MARWQILHDHVGRWHKGDVVDTEAFVGGGEEARRLLKLGAVAVVSGNALGDSPAGELSDDGKALLRANDEVAARLEALEADKKAALEDVRELTARLELLVAEKKVVRDENEALNALLTEATAAKKKR